MGISYKKYYYNNIWQDEYVHLYLTYLRLYIKSNKHSHISNKSSAWSRTGTNDNSGAIQTIDSTDLDNDLAFYWDTIYIFSGHDIVSQQSGYRYRSDTNNRITLKNYIIFNGRNHL